MIKSNSSESQTDAVAKSSVAIHQAQKEKSFPPQKFQLFVKQPWSLICGLLIVGAGAGWGANWWFSSQKAPAAPTAAANQPQGVPVKLETVAMTTIEEASELVGTLDSRRSVILKSEIDARVSQILVHEGDRVQLGQVVMRLDSEDLKTELMQAKAELANAKAKLTELQVGSRVEDINQARASLQQSQARLNNAQGGALPEAIAQAQAQLDSAQAEADLAEQRVKRYRELETQGAVSLDQFEQYRKEARRAIASVKEAQRRLAELSKGRSSDIKEMSAAVEEARQNLRKLENGPRPEEIAQAIAQVAQAQAQVHNIEVKVQKTNILAPTTGIVGDIPIKVGDYVSKGDPLTSLTQNNALELNLSVPLEKASSLRLGLPVAILDAEGKASARGKISFISPEVTGNAQAVLAKARFSNGGGELLNRQLVQARVIWQQKPGILVPTTAISRLGGETFVFVAEQSEKGESGNSQLIARQKPVKLGSLQGNNYQVLDGLKPGEKIVIAGTMNLSEGAPITPVPESKQ